MIAESNPQIFSDRETYLNYIATRPNVEKHGEHGLFGVEDAVELAKVKEEVSNHNGVIWTPIVSLKREDAARLGYDNAQMWQSLIRAKQMDLAAAFGIPDEDFRWYGAFHNEGHHPHMHMVVYSAGSKWGFLREKDIEKVKSILANEIFKHDRYELYDEKAQVYVFEAPVDMLSYITLHKENWQQHSYVCLGGVAVDALNNILQNHPQIDRVYLCVDNDTAVGAVNGIVAAECVSRQRDGADSLL